ncbi:hypothetical protein NITLEN_11098 [Nitrospira lenta]|uniref:Uncharacterized protein n=1 Tax=Nitrospira lenta TaxID=1436998 RepID=A0A330L518_9BACT|nr:hypothetical protein NITLEN_11098 [Nitrospira lenta]
MRIIDVPHSPSTRTASAVMAHESKLAMRLSPIHLLPTNYFIVNFQSNTHAYTSSPM